MAVTFTPTPDHAKFTHIIGDMHLVVGVLNFSGSYATGGDSVDIPSLIAVTGVGQVLATIGAARGNTLEYDSLNKKLKVYSSANTELAAGAYNAALTASPVPFAVIGR